MKCWCARTGNAVIGKPYPELPTPAAQSVIRRWNFEEAETERFLYVNAVRNCLPFTQERRKKEGAGVSRRDVAKYLNQQKKEEKEAINSPFAAAFAKMNLDN